MQINADWLVAVPCDATSSTPGRGCASRCYLQPLAGCLQAGFDTRGYARGRVISARGDLYSSSHTGWSWPWLQRAPSGACMCCACSGGATHRRLPGLKSGRRMPTCSANHAYIASCEGRARSGTILARAQRPVDALCTPGTVWSLEPGFLHTPERT